MKGNDIPSIALLRERSDEAQAAGEEMGLLLGVLCELGGQ